MKKNLHIMFSVFSILGCLLGAGFISGAEINSFFVRFGLFGLVGIVVASVGFGFVIYFIGENEIKDKTRRKINFLPMCQIFIAGAMLAGLIDVLSNTIGINKGVVLVITFIALLIMLLCGINFANGFNVFVTLFLICILPFVVVDTCPNVSISDRRSLLVIFPSLIYSILYIAMNTVACITIIQNVVNKNKRYIKVVSIISSIFVMATLTIFYFLIINGGVDSSMPIIELIKNKFLKKIYTSLFVFAMTSTLLSAANGGKKLFAKMDNKSQSLCTCIAIFCVSFLGFGSIIEFVYPVIGALLLLQFLINNNSKIVKSGSKKCKKYNKKVKICIK